MTFVKDIAWLLLIGLLLPLLMLVGLVCLVVIIGRQLYWWMRGNTTAVSRPPGRPRWSWSFRRRRLFPDGGPSSYRETPAGARLPTPGEPTPAVHT